MDNNLKKHGIITSLLIFFLTSGLTVGSSFLFEKTKGELIQFGVLCAVMSFFIVFVFLYEFLSGHFEYDNGEHPYRFLIIYSVSLVLSLLFPFVDRGGWVFVSLSIALTLFSNVPLGLFSTAAFILFSTLLSPAGDIYTFAVYFFAALIGVMVFQNIDENFSVGLSIFITQLCMLVLETAGFILLENEELNAEQFVYPIVNIVINSIILFVVLKYFNEKVANRYRNKYLELNDQEYEALIKLKALSKDEYFRSIHTAYLTERIANACNANVFVAKNLAYYHRIKTAFGMSMSELNDFVNENGFPPEARKALLDFSDKNTELVSKEACIVYLSDRLISTLMLAFSKDKYAKIDYKELIDTLLDKPSVNEELENSDFSRRDFKLTREIMKKEVLYYDFLR